MGEESHLVLGIDKIYTVKKDVIDWSKPVPPMQTKMTISVICNDNFGVESFTLKSDSMLSRLDCKKLHCKILGHV